MTTTSSLETAAGRLATLLAGAGTGVSDPTMASLAFEESIVPRPLERRDPPADVWAVDGGQATVADARCVRLVVTRAARARVRHGACVLEEEGELRAHLLGGAEERIAALLGLRLEGLGPDTPVDVNLLRDRWEWEAVERSVDEAERGAMVLVDGDLQPDWRIPSAFLSRLLARADERGVLVAGVTKHSSLSRGGAPLVGQLELEAAEALGPRSRWWAPVARSRASERPDLAGIQVVVARLDPDARFAFRVDLPAGADAEEALGRLAGHSDDAAFPGYPYALSVADRLAACPSWLRDEAWLEVDELLGLAGVPFEVRERAFTDRHALMERA
ncbi:MAG: DNA double-strand break repair nuclease NurA [Actinomycetota bacterium]|nr:DNA double-strand break repair nuclease NurA [Actinomycetota bacterium]